MNVDKKSRTPDARDVFDDYGINAVLSRSLKPIGHRTGKKFSPMMHAMSVYETLKLPWEVGLTSVGRSVSVNDASRGGRRRTTEDDARTSTDARVARRAVECACIRQIADAMRMRRQWVRATDDVFDDDDHVDEDED